MKTLRFSRAAKLKLRNATTSHWVAPAATSVLRLVQAFRYLTTSWQGSNSTQRKLISHCEKRRPLGLAKSAAAESSGRLRDVTVTCFPGSQIPSVTGKKGAERCCTVAQF
jgi:hypothetical protein